ncbi:hypothetical protein M0804_011913 [Polistes exclamans]|nr:hypothetical protein M0804_011913 [Polistes exclamans]
MTGMTEEGIEFPVIQTLPSSCQDLSTDNSLPGNGLHVLFPGTAQNRVVTLLPLFEIVVPKTAALLLAPQLWLRDVMFCHGLLFAVPRPGIHPEHQLAPPRGKTMA